MSLPDMKASDVAYHADDGSFLGRNGNSCVHHISICFDVFDAGRFAVVLTSRFYRGAVNSCDSLRKTQITRVDKIVYLYRKLYIPEPWLVVAFFWARFGPAELHINVRPKDVVILVKNVAPAYNTFLRGGGRLIIQRGSTVHVPLKCKQ